MQKSHRANQAAPDQDDLTLVDRVLSGDRRAFESLVRRHERRVFRVALAVLRNIEDAEEVMQDAFVKAFRHLDQFRREARFSTWLTRIAANEAIEKRSTRKNYVPLGESVTGEGQVIPKRYEPWRSNPEELYSKQEIHRVVEGLSAEEAAEALGITVPALKSRLLRARLMMRETLAEKFEEPTTLKTRILHTAVDAGTAVAMRL